MRAGEQAAAVLLAETAGIADARAVEWHRALMRVKHAWRLDRARSERWHERAGELLDGAAAWRDPS